MIEQDIAARDLLPYTPLRRLLNGTAINVVRVAAWLRREPLGERQRKPGQLAQLASIPYLTRRVLFLSWRISQQSQSTLDRGLHPCTVAALFASSYGQSRR